MAQTKATKKFERKHLKDTLQKRKDVAKIKQRHAVKAKKKTRRAADNAAQSGSEDASKVRRRASDGEKTEGFQNMDVDDFFQSSLDLADEPKELTRGKKRKRDHVDQNGGPKAVESSDIEGEDSDSEGEQDMEAHQQQLENLAEKDPDFYKYLEENDPELLELQGADFDDDLSISADEAVEDGDKKSQLANGSDDSNVVNQAMLLRWEKSLAEHHSLRASKEVILAFNAAAHSADEEDRTYKYSVSDPQIYHALLVLALERIPRVLQHHLPMKETSSGKIRLATETKKFGTLTPLIRSFLNCLIYLLGYLSDALTLRLTLTSLEAVLPYTLSFRKLVRDIAKVAVNIWSTSSFADSSRLAAFLVLRKMTVIGDPSIKESVLKAAYQGLVKGARNTTVHTLAGINLMKNSAAELFGLDAGVGYTSAFNFVRQLAVHLRSTITNNANESYKLVYNWQYVHSLDFWSRVLALHCNSLTEAKNGKSSSLRPLIYPVVQVTLGALRLIPTAAYFPLRFHLTRSLLRLSSSTGTYIPLAATLYEVLQSSEMRKPPKGSSLKALDFSVAIRVNKSYLGTRVYQDGLGEQLQELLSEFFVLWSKSIAFPELTLPFIILLKRWLKEVGPRSKNPNQNSKVTGMITLLAQKLDANVKWIEERRAKVEFAPNNRSGVENFLKEVEWDKTPLGAFVKGQRRIREEKLEMLEQARKDEERSKHNAAKDDTNGTKQKKISAKASTSSMEEEDEVDISSDGSDDLEAMDEVDDVDEEDPSDADEVDSD